MSDLRRTFLLVQIIFVGCVVLLPTLSHAQWWSLSAAPRDFEECAERAKTPAAGKDTVAECEAKFAGRRRMGGGYTYFDFMQNRSFDIAGPNPTADESRKIDEQYTAYLAEQRRAAIATAFLRKQQQPTVAVGPEPPNLSLKSAQETKTKVSSVRKAKVETCEGRVSCSLQALSTKIQSIRKNLFGS